MPLNTSTIKKILAATSWMKKDDEARNIINEATPAELKNLNAEGVLRLYEVLNSGFYSFADAAAMKKLATNTQFQLVTKTPEFGVTLVKKASLIHGNAQVQRNIQSQLTSDLVMRIYAAEKKRFDLLEQLGFDGNTIGRGQVGQKAYEDVKDSKYFTSTASIECLTRVRLAQLLSNVPKSSTRYKRHFDMKTYKVKIPAHYNQVYQEPLLEDFVVAAYLAIRITIATKNGRSPKDTTRFAVALYHGMKNMVIAAQTAVGDEINWAPVEVELLRQGYKNEVDYVNEVVK